jgi:hypothetical protein
LAELGKKLPQGTAPPDMPTAEIIQRCRPPKPEIDANSFVDRFARWLALWTFYAMTDHEIRDQAIDMALDTPRKR